MRRDQVLTVTVAVLFSASAQGGARLRVIVRDSTTGAVGSVAVPIEQNHKPKGH